MLLFQEIKKLIHNKVIIFLLLAGPILLTIYFGGVYNNTYIEDIPIVILDDDNSQMSRFIVQEFVENDRFYLRNSVENKDELRQIIDSKEAYMGIYIPKGFEQDIKQIKLGKILILSNGTNVIISNNAYAQAALIIKTIAAGVEINFLQAKGLMPQESESIALAFNISERMLYDPRMKYSIYLIFPFIAVFLQQLFISGIGVVMLNDTKSIVKDKSFRKILSKIIACSLFILPAIYISIITANKLFEIPVRGNIYEVILYSFLFIIAISCPAIIIAALTKDRLRMYQISFMLSLPTFVTCSAVWPKEMMPQTMVNIIKILWPLIYFDRPFAEILIKGSRLTNYMDNILNLIIYTLIWFPTAVFIFKYTNGTRYRVPSERKTTVNYRYQVPKT